MKRKSIRLAILFLISVLWIHVHLFLGVLPFSARSTAYAFSPTPSTTPTPSVSSGDAILQFLGTLLTVGAIIVAAIISGLFIVYQVHKNRALERENQRIQRENQETQRRLEVALHRQRLEDDVEKAHYDDWLVARREALEYERRRRIETRAATKNVMVHAQTPAEREEAYRKAVHADPDISQLQILDMAHPLEVAKVYVPLRVHQEVKLGYEIEPTLHVAESKGDPNALLKATFSFMETRTRMAMTPEEALQKYPQCVVLGDPGAGKSTLLKYLTLKSVDRQLPNLPELPVHIALSDFAASPKQDLIAFAAERWEERYGFPEDDAQAYIEAHLEDGSAMLLLDALDETVIGGSDKAAQESYSRVLEAIDRVATRYRKAHIIVTARKAGYYRRAHLSGFAELEVLDFRLEEIKEFVENWFKHHPAPPKHATADELNTQLERNPRMQSLATNPLLLCLIVLVYESHQDLPEKRAELYKKCIDTLLSHWDTSRDLRRRRRFRTEHKQQLLTEIAWHFHQQGRRYFPEDELLRIIGDFLPTVNQLPEESKAILNEIEEENGLLKEQAHGWHGFLHLTLQEYFVAQYAIGMRNGLNELLRHTGDPWWEEVITLYAGCVHDASFLVHELLIQEKKHRVWKDIFHTSLLLAGQCLAAKPRLVQRELREEIISSLFVLLRSTPYPLLREQIIKTLASIGSNDTWGSLLLLIKNKQEKSYTRWKTVRALGELGDQTVVPNLLSILKDKADTKDVRDDAAAALGELGDQTVVPDLLSILKDKADDSQVRWNAARALGKLGDQTVVPDLLSILKDKADDRDVRDDAARALGKLGDQTVVPDLLSILKDKADDSQVRWNAAVALAQLGDQTVVPDLLSILKDKADNKEVRWNAAVALAQLGDQNVVPDLLSILKDKADATGVRWNAARALAQLGDQTMVPDLLSILKDKTDDSQVRIAVGLTLNKFGQREAVVYLTRLFTMSYKNIGTINRANILGDLMQNFSAICAFAQLLKHTSTDINNILYQALWGAAAREKVGILMFNWRRIKLVRVTKKR